MVGTVFPSKQVVAAPAVETPRYSLLIAANAIQNAEEWWAGVEWAPEQRKGGGLALVNCVGSTPGGLGTNANVGTHYGDPFAVYAEDHCSTFGWLARDYEGRARRQLEAVQSAYIAAELERGALASANTLDNNWLTKSPTNVGAPAAQPVANALGDIEMGLADLLGGSRGMVHVSPGIFIALRAANAIDSNGKLWITPMGTVVVSDAGYKGHAPDLIGSGGSSKQWMYGTGMISYRLGEVMLNPGTLAEARSAATDRSTNLTTIFAERLALLQWDGGVVCAETDIQSY